MEISIAEFIGRPYFLINDQLADLYGWFIKGATLLSSNQAICGLVIAFLLLIGLLQMWQE
ncbi:hypothetical protein [Fibrivirga algicola]|uniref:hypothetical protein n=1 Tax=Fibrivirga algicola TaxID=2950420 RepID=UPI0014192DB1|nr:hypothetical protein [Fibrivirga algicola]